VRTGAFAASIGRQRPAVVAEVSHGDPGPAIAASHGLIPPLHVKHRPRATALVSGREARLAMLA